jgi:thiol:disulfide interchange protein DsbD
MQESMPTQPSQHPFHARRAPAAPRATIAASALLLLLTSAGAARAQAPRLGEPVLDEPRVMASLVADVDAIAPGATFRLAVRLQPVEPWHVNWINPGDAGLAPSVAWQLPDGFVHDPACWPLPERFRTGPLVIFGYDRDLVLAVTVRAPDDLKPGTRVSFDAGVSWLACADACIPGGTDLSLSLPVEKSARPDPDGTRIIEAAASRCPAPAGTWTVQGEMDNSGAIAMNIRSATPGTPALADVFFFPYDPGIIDNAAPQRLTVLASPSGGAAYQLRVDLSRMGTGAPARLSGILVSSNGWSTGQGAGAIEIDVPLEHH